LLLARKVEDEEDRTRGLVRPIRSADVALQHAEQFRGDLPYHPSEILAV
jgi:hypothetical protein